MQRGKFFIFTSSTRAIANTTRWKSSTNTSTTTPSSRSRSTPKAEDFLSLPYWGRLHGLSSSSFLLYRISKDGIDRKKQMRVSSSDFSPFRTPIRGVHHSPPIPPSSPLDIPLPALRSSSSATLSSFGSDGYHGQEAFNAARDALLQFNLMVSRGIEPDALMYTSLIATMARARLEWHAYKLFSRMIEAHVHPLPETYIALRDATSPSRRVLREDIQRKVEEAIATFPDTVAEVELERRRREDKECWNTFMMCLDAGGEEVETVGADWPTLSNMLGTEDEKGKNKEGSSSSGGNAEDKGKEKQEVSGTEKRVEGDGSRRTEGEEGMKGEHSPSFPSSSEVDGTEITSDTGSGISSFSSSHPPPLATVKIRHPREVWHTAQLAETLREDERGRAKGGERDRLIQALSALHEEELRIFLAIHRQLRHGGKQALIHRILQTVNGERIQAMLERRKYYFRSVEKLLKDDLQVVKGSQGHSSSPSTTAVGLSTSSSAADVSSAAGPVVSPTLSANEEHRMKPDVLYTPWGFLRKPARLGSVVMRGGNGKSSNTSGDDKMIGEEEEDVDNIFHGPGKGEEDRGSPIPFGTDVSDTMISPQFLRIPLSEEELSLVRAKALCSEMDELPDALLRRYAYMFRLRWRRREMVSGGGKTAGRPSQALAEVVRWHATTFFEEVSDPSPPSSSSSFIPTNGEGEITSEGVDNTTFHSRKGNSESSSSSVLVFTPSPAATVALRRQREKEGMQATLDHYEAFRLMAHRTQNLQVVDHKEINLHLHRIRREARAASRQAEDIARREGHRKAALSMAHRATQFDGPLLRVEEGKGGGYEGGEAGGMASSWNRGGIGKDGGDVFTSHCSPRSTSSRVLGLGNPSTPRASPSLFPSSSLDGTRASRKRRRNEPLEEEESPQEEEELKREGEQEEEGREELPPWELTGKEEEFDLSTGRFGDPNMGMYRELSDSHIRLLPQQEAEKKWRVDTSLLPSSLKIVLHEATQEQERVVEEMEREYHRRLQYKKYKKWDAFLTRAKEKKKMERAEEDRREYAAQEESRRKWEERRRNSNSLSIIEEGKKEGREGEEKSSSSFSGGRERGRLPRLPRGPIPPAKRLSQLLRKGLYRQSVSMSLREKYNPSL